MARRRGAAPATARTLPARATAAAPPARAPVALGGGPPRGVGSAGVLREASRGGSFYESLSAPTQVSGVWARVLGPRRASCPARAGFAHRGPPPGTADRNTTRTIAPDGSGRRPQALDRAEGHC